jgi:poly-gamma-glutamate synthase PgsB/CapB
MDWVLGISILLLALLLLEAALLRRAVNGIPCRVLVTGTRGKSGLVKILTAGIRESEPRTWGKITGDVASSLAPDGTSNVLKRRGPAHLREQAKFLRDCRRKGGRCAIIESMAFSPEAMIAESRLVRPTLVVITNVRDDHRETLGSEPEQRRAAYLSSVPRDCRWLSLDEELLAYAAASGRYPAPVPRPHHGDASGDPDDSGAVAETVANAEAALDALGWNTEAACRAVRAAAAQAQAPQRVVSCLGRRMTLLDAFSANDPQSLDRLWADWRRAAGDASSWSVLFNTRADRPLRTRRFCRWLAERGDVDEVYLAGSHAPAAARLLREQKPRVTTLDDDKSAIMPVESEPPSGASRDVLVGIGNVRGLGSRLREAPRGGSRP